jgi:hypothetical protein
MTYIAYVHEGERPEMARPVGLASLLFAALLLII